MPKSEFWQRSSPYFGNLAKNSPKLLQIGGKVAKICSFFWQKIATSGHSACLSHMQVWHTLHGFLQCTQQFQIFEKFSKTIVINSLTIAAFFSNQHVQQRVFVLKGYSISRSLINSKVPKKRFCHSGHCYKFPLKTSAKLLLKFM